MWWWLANKVVVTRGWHNVFKMSVKKTSTMFSFLVRVFEEIIFVGCVGWFSRNFARRFWENLRLQRHFSSDKTMEIFDGLTTKGENKEKNKTGHKKPRQYYARRKHTRTHTKKVAQWNGQVDSLKLNRVLFTFLDRQNSQRRHWHIW